MKKLYLSINQCPHHVSIYSVNFEDENSGIRITPSKCCGSWKQLTRWKLTKKDWVRIIEEAGECIDELNQ